LPFLRTASSQNSRYLDLKNWSFAKNVLPFVLQYKLSKKSIALQLSILNLKSIGNMEAIPKNSIANSIAILLVLQY